MVRTYPEWCHKLIISIFSIHFTITGVQLTPVCSSKAIVFPDKIFHWHSWQMANFQTFPWHCNIPRYFQVFPKSGHTDDTVEMFSTSWNCTSLLCWIIKQTNCDPINQGSHGSWKVLNLEFSKFRTWKVLKLDIGPEKVMKKCWIWLVPSWKTQVDEWVILELYNFPS